MVYEAWGDGVGQVRRIGILIMRAHSERIPGKHLKMLGGHPLMAWILASATAARLDAIIVSSDSDDILDRTPVGSFKVREPAHLARTTSPDFDVFEHALRGAGLDRGRVGDRRLDGSETILHLRATAPFVRADEINTVAEALETSGLGSMRSVIPARHHPRKMYLESWPYREQPTITPATLRHAANDPSQTLEPAWAAAGFVDAVQAQTILSRRSMESAMIGRWIAPADRAIELDTEQDWAIAEDMIRAHGWRPGHV